MLAIVIPTILATLAFAWWFRATNKRARYLPDWAYSGRIELIVWSIPALVVFFLGGIAWIGSHDLDPARPLASNAKPLGGRSRLARLEMAVHLSRARESPASTGWSCPSAYRCISALPRRSVLNVFFVPQLGSEIYAMNGMAEPTQPAGRPGRRVSRPAAHFSGDGFSDMEFEMRALTQADFAAWAQCRPSDGAPLDDDAYRALLRQSQNVTPYTYSAVQAGLVRRHPVAGAATRRRAHTGVRMPRSHRAEK